MRRFPLTPFVLVLALTACKAEENPSPKPKKAPEVRSSDKHYNGRTLSQWFEEIDSTPYKQNKEFWVGAEKAVNALGPESVDEIPFLIAELKKKVLRQHGALHCQVALTKIGAPAAKPVSELLLSEQLPLKELAMEVLKRMGRNAAGAIENLGSLYNDPNETIRNDARKLLYKLCRGNKAAQQIFIQVLKTEPPDQKLYVARRLAKLQVQDPKLPSIIAKLLPSASPELKIELQKLQEANPSTGK